MADSYNRSAPAGQRTAKSGSQSAHCFSPSGPTGMNSLAAFLALG